MYHWKALKRTLENLTGKAKNLVEREEPKKDFGNIVKVREVAY